MNLADKLLLLASCLVIACGTYALIQYYLTVLYTIGG